MSKGKTHYIGGGKGGVGKSVVTSITAEHYLEIGEPPILIETDNNNPDTYLAYRGILGDGMSGNGDAYAYDIDSPDGWKEIVRVIRENPDRNIIMNGAARDRLILRRYGEIFEPLDITTLWVVYAEPDGLATLKEFLEMVKTRACVVLNGHCKLGNTPESDFTDWNKSKLKNERNIPSVYLPDNINARELIDRSKNTCSYGEVYEKMHLGEQMFADLWLKKAKKAIEQAIEIAAYYNTSTTK